MDDVPNSIIGSNSCFSLTAVVKDISRHLMTDSRPVS